jgi:DNA modification methylase
VSEPRDDEQYPPPWKRREVVGLATLYLGDCREIAPTLPRPAAVISDPPYGIGFESNRVVGTTSAGWMRQQIANDQDTSARDAILEWHVGAWAMFGSERRDKPANTRGTLVWDKGPASGMGDLSFPWKTSYELIFVGGDGWRGHRDEGVIKGHSIVTRASMGRVHPNEKPVSLMAYLISKAPAGAILDPYMGSGSTGVAAVQMRHPFVGIEIEERYFDIALRRIAEAQRQGDMFRDSAA